MCSQSPSKLDADALQLDAEEAAAKRASPLADPAKRRAMLRDVDALRRAWTAAAPEAKRRIVGHLASAVRIVAGEGPAFVWRTAEELAEFG